MVRNIVETNLVGTFNVLRFAAHSLLGLDPRGESERGVIIATASVAAFDGRVGQVA